MVGKKERSEVNRERNDILIELANVPRNESVKVTPFHGPPCVASCEILQWSKGSHKSKKNHLSTFIWNISVPVFRFIIRFIHRDENARRRLNTHKIYTGNGPALFDQNCIMPRFTLTQLCLIIGDFWLLFPFNLCYRINCIPPPNSHDPGRHQEYAGQYSKTNRNPQNVECFPSDMCHSSD